MHILSLVLHFLAGALGFNGVPHFLKGISGERRPTRPDTPPLAASSVLWGGFNLFLSFTILVVYKYFRPSSFTPSLIAFSVGGMIVTLKLMAVSGVQRK